jgi:hypothetical protein
VSDYTQLLLRCRDCCISLHKKKKQESYVEAMRNVNALMEGLFDNLFPGANYQRLITSLELLKVTHACFFNFQFSEGMNKASCIGGSGPGPMIQSLQDEHALMHFYTLRHMDRLLTAGLLHYMIDVKTLAADLLAHFRPLAVSSNMKEQIVDKATALASTSPKFTDCESAALLFKLCGLYGQQNLDTFLLETFSKDLHRDEPFLAKATSAPMHGLLTSLRTVLASETHHEIDFYNSLMDNLETAIEVMLRIMGGHQDFAQMGQAVGSLTTTEDEVTISDEHSLVMACAWLNLKECCLVSSLLHKSDDPAIVQRAGSLIARVLTETRHKGALEAAATAMTEFCSKLLTLEAYGGLPQVWLLKAIDEMSHASASITRRSAGLPLLVRGIVTSEPRGSSGGRKLLNLAMSKLLSLLDDEAADEKFVSETRDMAQCHALHVLKALIHDSLLAHDVLPHLARILRQCVRNFHSKHWGIRNAGTHECSHY